MGFVLSQSVERRERHFDPVRFETILFSPWRRRVFSLPSPSRLANKRQGKSGLGLEAQREAVAQYLNGGDWRLAAEVVEIESGKRNDRPKLGEALRLCRLHGATLMTAKLDRLARNVAFVSNLMEPGVEFTAVDFRQANRLTVHILAAVAEHEAKAISDRTKAALAAAKRRGKVPGASEDRRAQARPACSGSRLYAIGRRPAPGIWRL